MQNFNLYHLLLYFYKWIAKIYQYLVIYDNKIRKKIIFRKIRQYNTDKSDQLWSKLVLRRPGNLEKKTSKFFASGQILHNQK